MMKRASLLSIFSFLACHVSGSAAQDVGSVDDTLLASLAHLEVLEEAAGNIDLVLAEPLLQLADEYHQRGRFADAHSALDRGMQIVRINEGLFARSQLPYLEKKIDNFADWGDWDNARDLMEHLLWLHRNKTAQIDAAVINDLLELSRFHIRGISEDLQEQQTYHFRRALATNWLAVAAGQRIWSNTDRRLVPMLYSLLQQYHLQAVAVERGGRTGYELREIIPGANWVRERSEITRYFYETGLGILRQMHDIYQQDALPDPEAVAMVKLYQADWQLMFSDNTAALESYALAFDSLTGADVPVDLVNHYFAVPSLIPETEFHTSLADSLAARAIQPGVAGGENLAESLAVGSALYFAEWSATFPHARSPYTTQDIQGLDSNFALFSFNLSGVSEFTRWLSRQRVQQFAELLDVTLLEVRPNSLQVEPEVRQRLQRLDFRPRLVDGEPEESSATLFYQLAPEFALPLP